jgi:hypothetical protein
MKANFKTKINGNEVSVIVYPDGKCAPISNEVLKIAGLELLIPEIEEFYNLLGYVKPEILIKWIAYSADMTCRSAYEKLIKYLLLDAGCRAQFAQTETIQKEEVDMLRYFLSTIEEEHFYSSQELAELLNKEGFDIKIKNSTIKNYINPSELYEWTLNNLDSMSLEQQETILKNLEDLKWIPSRIKELTSSQREIFKLTVLNKIDDKNLPFCAMSISCILYNLRLNGVDVTDMVKAVNKSECFIEEIKKMFNKEFQ